MSEAEEAQALCARWIAAACSDRRQSGVALDFAHGVIAAGRNTRVLSIVDAFTRECLALQLDADFASRRVTRVLDEIFVVRGRPMAIPCVNGPALTSRQLRHGPSSGRLICDTFSRASRRRTRMWRAPHGRLRAD